MGDLLLNMLAAALSINVHQKKEISLAVSRQKKIQQNLYHYLRLQLIRGLFNPFLAL